MPTKQDTPVLLSEAKNNKDRRWDIVAALYRCMADKGFAASTLNDIANEAKMSSSHLLYYYDGKEAILEAFFKSVIDHVESQLANLPEDDVGTWDAFKAVGCGGCAAGYKGRFAIVETLRSSEALQRVIIGGAGALDIKAQAITGGMVTLRRAAMLNAGRGVTSIEEVLRVTMSD